jgi:hypothetical protein
MLGTFIGRPFRARLPPGRVSVDRPVFKAATDPAVTLSWAHAGGVPNFQESIVLAVGTTPQPADAITQVGSLRQIDVDGVSGTLRVATQPAGSANTTLYDDDLWWSPKPGVVVTLSLRDMPRDPSAELASVARSVAPSDATTAMPFRLPALPAATTLVSEWVYGSSPANWHVSGVVAQHQNESGTPTSRCAANRASTSARTSRRPTSRRRPTATP